MRQNATLLFEALSCRMPGGNKINTLSFLILELTFPASTNRKRMVSAKSLIGAVGDINLVKECYINELFEMFYFPYVRSEIFFKF